MYRHFICVLGVLLLAVQHNQNAIVEVLLVESHSDPNVSDKDGKTPLNLSNDPDHEIIKLLLKHGAKAANVLIIYNCMCGFYRIVQ